MCANVCIDKISAWNVFYFWQKKGKFFFDKHLVLEFRIENEIFLFLTHFPLFPLSPVIDNSPRCCRDFYFVLFCRKGKYHLLEERQNFPTSVRLWPVTFKPGTCHGTRGKNPKQSSL
jgi:hypothetical protein